MFISEQQLKDRLNSPKNIINIIKSSVDSNANKPLSPDAMNVPFQDHPPIKDNLVNENNRERAARVARSSVSYGADKGEYTPNPNLSNDTVRATIGILAASKQATSQEIQREFGVTKNQIIGAVKSKRKSLAARIEKGKDRVSELAIDKLMHTLGLLTPEKIAECSKVKEISDLAVSLAKVTASMSSAKTSEKEGQRISLTVVSPGIRDIGSYTTIDV